MVIFLEVRRILYLRKMKTQLEKGDENKFWGDDMFGGTVMLNQPALCWRLKFTWTPFYGHVCTTDHLCNQYRFLRDSTCPRPSGTYLLPKSGWGVVCDVCIDFGQSSTLTIETEYFSRHVRRQKISTVTALINSANCHGLPQWIQILGS